MKKCFALVIMMIISLVYVFADTQLGRTEGSLSDNSFVIQAYYRGASADTSMNIKLSFKDYANKTINHDEQGGTSGTKVEVSNSHIGTNTGTIFTWEMTGKYGKQKTVTLKFVFSTLQAELNGHYYRPTYTLTMTQNQTVNNSNNSNLNDSFYSSDSQVVGGGVTTGLIADSDTEFSGPPAITYSGKITSNFNNNNTWKRSGTCTLNIAEYKENLPGSYHYVCWVIAEFSVT